MEENSHCSSSCECQDDACIPLQRITLQERRRRYEEERMARQDTLMEERRRERRRTTPWHRFMAWW